jgi:uncharacterized membrane protein
MNTNSSVAGKPDINVGTTERMLSGLTGSLLLFSGLRNGNLGFVRALIGGFLLYRGITGNCPGYTAIGKEKVADPVRNINIRTSVTVNKSADELYAFWRRLENLPLFMKHLDSVVETDSKRSHWKARVPGGLGTIEWKAEIVEERPGSFLGWNSMPGAVVENAGKVEFKRIAEDWTELTAIISYRAPLGIAGQGLSKLLNPVFENMITQDILNFKRFIEQGVAPDLVQGQVS